MDMSNELVYMLYVVSLFISIAGIAIAFLVKRKWSRLIAAALCLPISLLPARYHPVAVLIPMLFPLLVYRGMGLAHKGHHWRGLLYCGPILSLIFF